MYDDDLQLGKLKEALSQTQKNFDDFRLPRDRLFWRVWSSLGSLVKTDSPWATESRQIPIDRPISALPMNESKFLLFFQLDMATTCVQLVVSYEWWIDMHNNFTVKMIKDQD